MLSKAEKGKAGRGWGLKDGRLARSPQVFGSRAQQDHQGPAHGDQVAKFQQAAIGGGGGGTFGSASQQGRDFNLLSAFEQFVEGSQGARMYGGKTQTIGTAREEENQIQCCGRQRKKFKYKRELALMKILVKIQTQIQKWPGIAAFSFIQIKERLEI